MSAATAYGTNFNSSGKPLNGLPYTGPFSSKVQRISETIPTTSLDDAGDFFALTAVACGRKVAAWLLSSSSDFDSGAGALDMDLVLRSIGSDGTLGTPTILENAGTAYNAARTNQVIDLGGTEAPASATGYCLLGYYVNTAASTAAQGAVTGTLLIE